MRSSFIRLTVTTLSLTTLGVTLSATLACGRGDARPVMDAHDHGTTSMAMSSTTVVPNDTTLPPDAAHAVERLNASPRHGQYVMIPRSAKPGSDSIRAWIVYPERSTKAPVVVVIHEIFGLSSWVRSVADQLAHDGFIAIAPDLLSTQKLPGAPDNVSMQDGIAAVSKLNVDSVLRDIDVTANYAMAQPAALHKLGIIGFCWGGGVAFKYATHAPTLGASVVFYGETPQRTQLSTISAPVLGNYAGNDARISSTVPATDSAMKAQSKTYEHYIYEGAGHGFLRQQDGANGANLTASQKAWPATLAWFRRYLAP